MAKTKVNERTKKQQKYYLHLARQKHKNKKRNSPQVDVRRVIIKEKTQDDKNVSPTKSNINNEDAISIHASDSDIS